MSRQETIAGIRALAAGQQAVRGRGRAVWRPCLLRSRFAYRRLDLEGWFALTPEDLAAFRRWKEI